MELTSLKIVQSFAFKNSSKFYIYLTDKFTGIFGQKRSKNIFEDFMKIENNLITFKCDSGTHKMPGLLMEGTGYPLVTA